MRIALLTETFLPKIDGVVKALCHLLDHLNLRGHQTLLLAPEGSPDSYGDTPIVQMQANRLFFYPEFRLVSLTQKVAPHLDPFKPDLIHVVNPFALGNLGIDYACKNNIPLVASYQTDLPGHLDLWGFKFLSKPMENYLFRLHKQAQLNLAPSHQTRRELIKKGYKNVKVWSRGVDGDRFHPRHRNSRMRDFLSNGNNRAPLLLYVGRLSREKRVETLRPVLDAIPSAHLAIVGGGPMRSDLEALFAGTNTKFTGYLYDDELARACASADIFTFPGANETFGNVILEAMASGLPVVAPRAGGILNTMIDRETGFLYEPDDIPAMIYAIQRLINSRYLSRNMAFTARQRALDFSWEAILDQLIADYHQVIRENQLVTSLKVQTARKIDSLTTYHP